MSASELPGAKRPQRDLFDDETLGNVRLTPDADRREVHAKSKSAKEKSKRGDADWLAEVLPGEERPWRDLFDEETLRRVRLTPEGMGVRPRTVKTYADGASSWYWPPVSDITMARSAAEQGVGAALFVTIASLIFAGVVGSDFEPVSKLGFDPSDSWGIVVGAAVFLAIAGGIHCMSRIAAVLGLVIFLLDRAATIALVGPRVGMVSFALLMLVCFVNGVRGTFAYHQLLTDDSY